MLLLKKKIFSGTEDYIKILIARDIDNYSLNWMAVLIPSDFVYIAIGRASAELTLNSIPMPLYPLDCVHIPCDSLLNNAWTKKKKESVK
jgi:hypothetical protein